MYQKLQLIAVCLGMVPVNILNQNNPNFFVKYLNIIFNFIYLVLIVYGLFLRYLTDFKNALHPITMIVADSIEVFNEILTLSSVFIMSRLHRNEWSVFLNYLQNNFKDLDERDGRIDIVISIFAFTGNVIVTCYQFVRIRIKKGFFDVAYYSFYISSIYNIFLAAFLSLIGHILIRHQQKTLDVLKHNKTYFANEKCFCVSSPKSFIKFSRKMKKIRNEFTNICINIKNLNLLYGWQMLFIFSAGVVNVILFINFVVFHNSFVKNAMMTVTDSSRMIFYMVSQCSIIHIFAKFIFIYFEFSFFNYSLSFLYILYTSLLLVYIQWRLLVI